MHPYGFSGATASLTVDRPGVLGSPLSSAAAATTVYPFDPFTPPPPPVNYRTQNAGEVWVARRHTTPARKSAVTLVSASALRRGSGFREPA